MNPLFISHLAADFLLQTTRMVRWKMRHFWGVAAHGAVHAGVLALFLMPRDFATIGLILAIAAAHCLIDQIKILNQRRCNCKDAPLGRVNCLASLRLGLFGPSFLLDQLAHLGVLVAAAFAIPNFPSFWKSETGILIAVVTAFLSFGVGTWHLTHIPGQSETRQQKLAKAAILAFTFFCYIAAARIWA